MSVQYVTKETLDKLQAELQKMKAVDRPAAARAIAEAREKGDLKENAEYDAAKEAQGHHEAKIAKLEDMLANARVMDTSTLDLSKVSVMCSVRVKNLKIKKEQVFQLVSEKEANLKEGKISVNSPIGKGLLGKKVGEKAEITVPAGNLEFQILEIFI